MKKHIPQPENNCVLYWAHILRDYSSAITAVCTIVIAVFSGLMWSVSRQQASFIEKELVANRRAYVAAVGLNRFYEPCTKPGNSGCYSWRFRPVLRNFGYTPTRNMTFLTECILSENPLATEVDFKKYSGIVGKGMIPPQSEVSGAGAPDMPGSAITPQDLADVQSGKKHLYLRGWVKYNDVFPGTARHVTGFFWKIECGGNPYTFSPEGPSLPFGFTQHAAGNCTDEECPGFN